MSLKSDQKLLEAAIEVVKLMDKTADASLPTEIAGVVKLHAKLALGATFVPIPGADIAASAAAIWGMYIRINNKLNIPLGKNVMKTIAGGVATNLASYAVALGIGSALKFIPVIGSIGGTIVMSAAVYALTIASGYVYLRAIAALTKSNLDLTGDSLNLEINQVISENKDAIKSLIKTAEQDYKSNKAEIDNYSIDGIDDCEDITDQDDAIIDNSYTPEEEEYIQEVKECIAEFGEIGGSSRRLLSRIQNSLGITDERAAELEASLAPSLTEDESAYLEEYKLSLEESGGTLSDMDRRLLNRLRGKLDITEERAAEIESLA